MKTEDEARELRCCGPDGCGGWAHENDAPDIPDGGYVRYCIASDCMAWEWSETEYETRWKYSEGLQKLTAPKEGGWVEDSVSWTRLRENRRCDCGLKRSVP